MGSLSTDLDHWTSGPNLYPKRKPVPPAQRGIAAPCSTEQFKTKSYKHKPLAKRWHRKFVALLEKVWTGFILHDSDGFVTL